MSAWQQARKKETTLVVYKARQTGSDSGKPKYIIF